MSDFSSITEEICKEYCANNSLQHYRFTNNLDFWSIAIALNTPDVNRELGWDIFLLNMIKPFPNSIRKLRQMLRETAEKDEFFHPAVEMIDILLKTPILYNITWSDFLKKLNWVNHQPTFDCLYKIAEKKNLNCCDNCKGIQTVYNRLFLGR